MQGLLDRVEDVLVFMTLFGWLTVGLWMIMGFNSPTVLAKFMCVFMIIGTFAWGTGNL